MAWTIEESVDEVNQEILDEWINNTLFSVQTIDIPEIIQLFKDGLIKRAIYFKKMFQIMKGAICTIGLVLVLRVIKK